MKRKYTMTVLMLAVSLLLVASDVPAVSIGLFGDENCSSCNLTIAEGEEGTIYISIVSPDGIKVSSADFKVIGLPDGWTATFAPNPLLSIVSGDPLGDVGTLVVFGTSQAGDCLNLFAVDVTATSAASDVTLSVSMRTPPASPLFPCPRITFDCGPACDWIDCVPGGQLFVNSIRDCSVAVEAKTWSAVRRLYQ